jgi:GxxExxY protein
MARQLLFPELSYQILGCCFKVYKALGPFYREEVYQKALEIELQHSGLTFVRKKALWLSYHGVQIAECQLDLLVENSIILELKSTESIHPQHVSQLIQYLELANLHLGIVVNFGSLDKLAYRRVPH